jgi:nucleoside-diphosphate-sugar epimerase
VAGGLAAPSAEAADADADADATGAGRTPPSLPHHDEVVHVAGGRGFLGAAVVRALQRAGVGVSASGREGIAPDERPRITTLVWCAGSRAAELAALWGDHVEAPAAAMSALPALRAVIYTSSAEVYGTQPVPYPETAPRLGASAYARAKIYGEDTLTALCWPRGITLAIARPSVIYGPGQPPAMLLAQALAHLLRGEPLLVTAGAQTRDWLFVDDAAAALAALAVQRGHGVYNLGSGHERSVRGVLEQLAALVDADAAALIRWGALPYRDDETMRYALAIERARAELGWSPATTLEAGLAACVQAAR